MSEISGVNLGAKDINNISLRTLKYILDNPNDDVLLSNLVYDKYESIIRSRLLSGKIKVYSEIEKTCIAADNDIHYIHF